MFETSWVVLLSLDRSPLVAGARISAIDARRRCSAASHYNSTGSLFSHLSRLHKLKSAKMLSSRAQDIERHSRASSHVRDMRCPSRS
jgi:hypothetical protein